MKLPVKIGIKALTKKADLHSLKTGDLVTSNFGLLVLESVSDSRRYRFVSHHKQLIVARESAMVVDCGGIAFEESIPVELGRYNPRRDELSRRPLLSLPNSGRNRTYARRLELYGKTVREAA